MATISVVDVLAPSTPCEVEVAHDATVGDLRALALSLPLQSARQVLLANDGSTLVICHDGGLIGDDDALRLADLGVLGTPAVVVLASQPAPAPPRARPAAPAPPAAQSRAA